MINFDAEIRLMRIVAIVLGLMLVFQVEAQEGVVEIQKDSRIEALVNLYGEHHNSFNEKPGYRIQLVASTNRDKAYNAEAKFKSKYPQFSTYLAYTSPYFKLRACDFTDRLEALRFLYSIKGQFPSAFLVEQIVPVVKY